MTIEIEKEQEAEEIVPPTPIEGKSKKMGASEKGQNDIQYEADDSDMEVVIEGISIPEVDQSETSDIIEDAIIGQQSVAGSANEPTEYVIGGVALNGKEQEIESLSFDDDLSEEEEFYNSRRDSKKSSKNGKRNYIAESTSGNYYQDDTIQEEEKPIFIIVEEMPEFPGGSDSLYKFIANNIHYPDSAKEAEIQGKVYISFVINEIGNIENAKVMRGIGGGCDEEALRIVKSFPDWVPGQQRGKPVKVQMTLPINFKLTN